MWADEVETLIPSAEALEQRMMAYVWSQRHDELAVLEADQKDDDGWMDQDAVLERRLREAEDRRLEEEGAAGFPPGSWERRDKRPMMLYAPLVSGGAIILTLSFIGLGASK